jgi:hypothetical protein
MVPQEYVDDSLSRTDIVRLIGAKVALTKLGLNLIYNYLILPLGGLGYSISQALQVIEKQKRSRPWDC